MSTTNTTRAIATSTEPLTKEQVKAFREATSVAFHHNPYGNPDQRECGLIALYKKIPTPPGYTASHHDNEIRMEVPVKSRVTYWGRGNGGANQDSHPSGFYHEGCAQVAGVWSTIAKLIKAGDTLSMLWYADTYGEESDLRRAGYTQDSIKIVLYRGKEQYLEFLLHSTAIASHSTGRLVTRAKWGT